MNEGNKNSVIEEQLKTGQTIIRTTIGDSMKPLLYDKLTQVVIAPMYTELNVGDLPLYKRPSGQYVMHRIIRVDTECYYTRGDNRCGLEKIPKDWVIGVVTQIYRNNKEINVTDKIYQLYVRLWSISYPMRWFIYILRRGIRYLERRVLKV